jgi:predicted Zn-dependent peptidase
LITLKERGVSKQELDFAKKNHQGLFKLDMESTQSRMAFLSRIIMWGGKINSQAKYLKALDSVTVEQVNTVARELFKSRNWASACVLPKGVKFRPAKWMAF